METNGRTDGQTDGQTDTTENITFPANALGKYNVLDDFHSTRNTDRVSREGKSTGSVHLSVCLFPLYVLNRLTSELSFVCVWIMSDHSSPGIKKIKIMGQGQWSITRLVWLRPSIEDSFFSLFMFLCSCYCVDGTIECLWSTMPSLLSCADVNNGFGRNH